MARTESIGFAGETYLLCGRNLSASRAKPIGFAKTIAFTSSTQSAIRYNEKNNLKASFGKTFPAISQTTSFLCQKYCALTATQPSLSSIKYRIATVIVDMRNYEAIAQRCCKIENLRRRSISATA
jgi:hypothetical protein